MGAGAAHSSSATSRSAWLVPVVAIAQALVVLGPALGPGLVLTYDMAWSPDPRWTPFVLGSDTPAPRAVPSDAAAVLIGHVLGAEPAQKAILLGLLVALGLGAAALLTELSPQAGPAAGLAATVASVWNPFVHERLVVGQWTVLLGLAVLPWALRSGLRAANESGRALTVAGFVALAGLGGANTLVMVLLPLLAMLTTGALIGPSRRCSARSAAVALVVGLGVSAAWSLPALRNGAETSREGVTAFLPTADTPLGVVASLVSGGGFWNVATHPASRSLPLVAWTAAVLALLGVVALVGGESGRRRWLLVSALGAPTLVVVCSVLPILEPAWTSLVTGLPGGGLLRDSHKLIAPWLLFSAVGLGVLLQRVTPHLAPALAGPVMVLVVAMPVVLSPLLAWGASGRLAAADVPQDYRRAVEQLNQLPPGDVGLLPWSQYRRHEWNHGRVSLSLAPRMVTHTVVFDDSLPLRATTVAGESERAALISAAIASGATPAEALQDSGVRYVMVERGSGAPVDEAGVRASGDLVVETESVLVVELADPAASSTGSAAGVVGWSLTVATIAVVGTLMAARGVLRRGR